ncbi:hypothetical protein C8J56DRAFT_1166002 [Mycena floridula]|nr:hypothetical protein C8J56DRAFT_1166002 [Mycena floridula]
MSQNQALKVEPSTNLLLPSLLPRSSSSERKVEPKSANSLLDIPPQSSNSAQDLSIPHDISRIHDPSPSSAQTSNSGLPQLIKSSKVYIGNLPSDTREEELTSWFGRVGKILKVQNHRIELGYAFLEFEHVEDATECISRYHGRLFGGHTILVQMARSGVTHRERDLNTCSRCGLAEHWDRECPSISFRRRMDESRGLRHYSPRRSRESSPPRAQHQASYYSSPRVRDYSPPPVRRQPSRGDLQMTSPEYDIYEYREYQRRRQYEAEWGIYNDHYNLRRHSYHPTDPYYDQSHYSSNGRAHYYREEPYQRRYHEPEYHYHYPTAERMSRRSTSPVLGSHYRGERYR